MSVILLLKKKFSKFIVVKWNAAQERIKSFYKKLKQKSMLLVVLLLALAGPYNTSSCDNVCKFLLK